jgi:cytochrome c oxidase subunit 2
MQNLAWYLSIISTAAVAAVFIWVAAGAGSSRSAAPDSARNAFKIRDRLFWLVITAGACISVATLWEWPIAGHAKAAIEPDTVIHAVGHQWRWELDRDTVRVGELVQFEITAQDVNHGFAVYLDKEHLVAQAQAMPGYVNKLQIRFAEPGDYQVLCLEYCGLAHHNMRAVVKVRAEK